MLNDQLATFIDRREAIALFNALRGRHPDKPWPLLPILTFVAPGGSGKSMLLRYLREKECCSSGRPALPYAYLDFTLPYAPKELLAIFMALRDQLQQQDDGRGKHLVFPRFDLGSLIVQSALMDEDVSSLAPAQVRRLLSAGMNVITSLSDLGSSLGSAVPHVAPLLAGLRLAGQLKPVKDMLSYLEDSTAWKWYRMHGTQTGLGINATLRDVLLRLHVMSMPGKPERDFLVNELLPAAFLADLFDALLDSNPPTVWSKTANLIFFLDGFEDLQRTASETATRLLELLTVSQRKGGKTDPILLVVGGREYLPGSDRKDDRQIPSQRSAFQRDQQAVVKGWYAQWQQSLPSDIRYLRLEDLYLTVELQDFVQEDTRSYLLKFGEQRKTSLFADNEALVQIIGQLTQGHPLFLALAAAAALEANARGKPLTRDDFELEKVSSDIVERHSPERIRDYLLNLFLRQLSEAERKKLIFCAVPRSLDYALLRVLLPNLDDIDRQKRWDSYQRLTFMHLAGNDHLVFHPIVRMLLLRQLPADQAPESDYYRLHTALRDYFHRLAQKGIQSQEAVAGQSLIEEAYHALALGDPYTAIALGVYAQRNSTLWGSLLEAVMQTPAELLPQNGEQLADMALIRAEQHHHVQYAVIAIILYTWLLNNTRENSLRVAHLQHNLGTAYHDLPGGDQEANLRRAIRCYEAVLQVRTREAFPVQWAGTQNNLGSVYNDLPGGDREANLRRAISCFKTALCVYTREVSPMQWAGTQNNLGTAYSRLPKGDREVNLRQAIKCFEAALQVYTQEASPVEWAMTQNNLGTAYNDLAGENRAENLERAIGCYKAALQVYTREVFPVRWAGTQNNLGTAFSELPGGDRGANLSQAIECYEAALQIRTREMFPLQWATTQNNLGEAYRQLSSADRDANLRKAIKCYEAALQVYTREASPVEWAMTQNNLGLAFAELPGGDRETNLRKAIKCYEAALQIRTREALPMDWATTQNNLGSVYRCLSGGDRETNLRQAIKCYEATLQVYTREAFPVDWAQTQINLGNAYYDLLSEDREANLRQAMACYEAALQIYTREQFPTQWAGLQNNLGATYSNLQGGDREANLRQAIAYYEAALQVYTREAFPVDWSTTQNNLGTIYSNLLEGDREVNLRQAIECYEAALQIRTREMFPLQWATTQNNLGATYSNLPAGDREANLRQSIACYQAALQVLQMTHVDYYASVVSSNLEIVRNELRRLEQGKEDHKEVVDE